MRNYNNYCPFDNVELKEGLLHPDYKTCPKCKYSVKYKNIVDQNIEDYSKIYNLDLFQRMLNGDKNHYNRFFEVNKNLLNELGNKFKEIISLGGGFPKLETYLNPEKVIIYDFLSDVYEKHLDLFYQYFPNAKNIKIIYKKEMLSDNTIEKIVKDELETEDKTVLFTFIHILEHYFYEDFINLLDKFFNAIKQYSKNKEIYIWIYQPNIEIAKNKNWFHFSAIEHRTFIPLEKFKYLLENRYNLEIVESFPYSDDFLIVGKTEIKGEEIKDDKEENKTEEEKENKTEETNVENKTEIEEENKETNIEDKENIEENKEDIKEEIFDKEVVEEEKIEETNEENNKETEDIEKVEENKEIEEKTKEDIEENNKKEKIKGKNKKKKRKHKRR